MYDNLVGKQGIGIGDLFEVIRLDKTDLYIADGRC